MKRIDGKLRVGHQRVRPLLQIAIAAFVAVLAYGHTQGWGWAASIHTVCPFGGVANLYTYFSTGGYVAKLHEAVFIVLIALVAGLLLTGKSFCGWICPMGTVQEFLGKVGRRLWPRAYDRVPARLDKVLSWGKWAVLVLVLVQTARSAKLFFQPYDPYFNLFNIWTDEIALTGYLVVGLTLGASLFVERPFCRYACPLGAVNGLFNRFSLVRLRREPSTCTSCGRCDKACPVGIEVSAAGGAVTSIECTRCLACVEACPVNVRGGEALRLGSALGGLGSRLLRREPSPSETARRIPGRSLPATAFYSVAVLAFALPILLTSLSGDFVTETQLVYETPEDIKGSSPLADIAANFPVTQEALYNGFAIPADLDPATKLKDVQAAMGMAEGSEVVVPERVRSAIASLDLPLSSLLSQGLTEQERLEDLAAETGMGSETTLRELMERGTSGAVAYLLTGVRIGETAVEQATADGSAAAAQQTSVRGSTTLDDIEEMAGDFPAFLTKFGIPADEPGSSNLKDLATRYGFEVSAARVYLE